MEEFASVSIFDVIDIAITMERQGGRFYTLAAGACGDRVAMDLFIALAKAEETHESVFVRMRKFIRDKGPIDRAPDPGGVMGKFVRSWTRNKVFDGMDVKRFVTNKTVEQLVRQAIKLEDEAVEFFQSLDPYIATIVEQRALVEIIRQERTHKAKLEAILKKVEAATKRPD